MGRETLRKKRTHTEHEGGPRWEEGNKWATQTLKEVKITHMTQTDKLVEEGEKQDETRRGMRILN